MFKAIMETPVCRSGFFICNFEQISHILSYSVAIVEYWLGNWNQWFGKGPSPNFASNIKRIN